MVRRRNETDKKSRLARVAAHFESGSKASGVSTGFLCTEGGEPYSYRGNTMGVHIELTAWRQTPVLRAEGRSSSSDVLVLSSKLESIAKRSAKRVVLDLSGMLFIDSNWLGMLIGCEKIYRANGKELVFFVPPGPNRELFRDTGLERVFRFIESREELEEGEDTPCPLPPTIRS
ncbi:MAG: STAS domain-containing protein [Chitinivibrionales bacterium]|nr:STAS domain-containing protein [Chitinivibrionales bacterium]MBD3355733.1 STAS domain-containing protein [Chitinivibrionales bacterium]